MHNSKTQYTAELELLASAELECLLTLSVQPENQMDPVKIETILEILERRGRLTAPPHSAEDALRQIRCHFNTSDGKGDCLYAPSAVPETGSTNPITPQPAPRKMALQFPKARFLRWASVFFAVLLTMCGLAGKNFVRADGY